MDLTINNPPAQSPKSDTDSEAPPQMSHQTKALSLSNGLKRGTCQPQPPLQQMVVLSYKECLKNHAAHLGGLALDGCGEFMPSPTAYPLNPTSLKCAACGCHRNFHRRDPHVPPPALPWTSSPSPGPVSSSGPSSEPPSPPASPTPQNSLHPSEPHMLWVSSTIHSMPLDGSHHRRRCPSFHPTVIKPRGRKKVRTIFTQDQKEKMHAFAEKLGWKMQRGIDAERAVMEFCSEVGIKRNVFKVWMSNHRHRRENSNNVGFHGNGDRVVFANSNAFPQNQQQ